MNKPLFIDVEKDNKAVRKELLSTLQDKLNELISNQNKKTTNVSIKNLLNKNYPLMITWPTKGKPVDCAYNQLVSENQLKDKTNTDPYGPGAIVPFQKMKF